MFSPFYITKTGKKINLPDFDEDFYIDFMEKLIFNRDVSTRRALIMQPLPPQVSQLFFIIQRNATLMNKMNPTFELYLEKGGGEKIQILCAQKKKFTINNYYMIQLENDKNISRNSNKCLGKLRAINNEKDKYVLYDNGDAWDSKELEPNQHNLRKEHGAFVYRYEMCNVGNIRKMKIMFP